MESDEELRDELTAAIAKVRHQLEIDGATGGVAWGPNMTEARRELEAELAQLEEALAGLGPEAAAG